MVHEIRPWAGSKGLMAGGAGKKEPVPVEYNPMSPSNKDLLPVYGESTGGRPLTGTNTGMRVPGMNS